MNEKDLSYFVGSKIKDFRKKNNITQNELGRMLNVKNNTISAYERGVISTDQDVLFKLADIFKVSIDDFFPNTTNNVIQFPASSNYPFYPVGISAGLPNDVEGITNADTITLPDSLMGKYAGNKDIFITRVNGESMNKVIPHNSLIAVRPVSQESLKTGDILVYRKDSEYAVKRLVINNDKYIFKPESTDDSFYDDVITDEQEIAIKGKVVMSVIMYD